MSRRRSSWFAAGKMGLGSARDVPLSRARSLASEARRHLANGRDPLAMRAKTAKMTFGEAAAALVESMSSSWRYATHRAQWTMTLTVYAAPLAFLPAADQVRAGLRHCRQPGLPDPMSDRVPVVPRARAASSIV